MDTSVSGNSPQVATPIGAILAALALVGLVNAEYNLVIAMEPNFVFRFMVSCVFVAAVFGLSWAVGAVWNVVAMRPWQAPAIETLVVATLLMVGATIYYSWPNRQMPSRAAIVEVRTHGAERIGNATTPDGLRPYYGEVHPLPGACPEGQVRTGGRCLDRPELYVERGRLGGCPDGYVDHPSSPQLCTLPYVAERILAQQRPRQ